MTQAAREPATSGLPSRRSVSDVLFSSGAYHASLKGRVPKRLALVPVNVFSGDSDRADNMFQGQFDFAGFNLEQDSQEPWYPDKDMPLAWHRELHRFGWLRDFIANGSAAARRHARALVLSWIDEFETYHPHVWDEDVLNYRLASWFSASDFLLEKKEEEGFNYRFLRSMRQQYVHLARLTRRKSALEDRVPTWQALIYGALAFSDMRKSCGKLLASLETELTRVVLADGCHISRNPERHLMLMGELIGLRNSLMAAGEMVPVTVNNAIDRLAPAIRFFQHGDGKLALFNGGAALEEGYCDQLLSLSDATGRPPHRFPQGGFERVKAGRALLILESGEGGREKENLRHTGLLGFEFSYGRERLIVNCGGARDMETSWGRALASTAAHSTLSFGSLNAVFPPRGAALSDPGHSQVSRHEEEGNVWLDLNSEGYLASVGIRHRRRLYIDASGLALRGEDQIIPERLPAVDHPQFYLRFHLHPDLSISKSAGGRNILIRTPGGMGWKFLTGAANLTLEESIYCSAPGERRRNQQIVLTGALAGQEPLLIKWALSRLSD